MVSPDGKTLIVVNLKHRVSLDECIEDCEGYENAVNPPPGSDHCNKRTNRSSASLTFQALKDLGVDVMTRISDGSFIPSISYEVRTDILGDKEWHKLFPEVEKAIIDRIESDFGIRPSGMGLLEAISMYRRTGIDYKPHAEQQTAPQRR